MPVIWEHYEVERAIVIVYQTFLVKNASITASWQSSPVKHSLSTVVLCGGLLFLWSNYLFDSDCYLTLINKREKFWSFEKKSVRQMTPIKSDSNYNSSKAWKSYIPFALIGDVYFLFFCASASLACIFLLINTTVLWIIRNRIVLKRNVDIVLASGWHDRSTSGVQIWSSQSDWHVVGEDALWSTEFAGQWVWQTRVDEWSRDKQNKTNC